MSSISTIVKSIQDIMRQDAGIDGDAQRIGQLAWMFFLKIFDDREAETELLDPDYKSPIPTDLRWRTWAAPKEGITGEALFTFVSNDLFPTLKQFAETSTTGRANVIGNVFQDAFNYMKNGTLIRQVVNRINEIDFNRSEDRHLFGDIYEQLLKDLQSAGNSGEYYTPRAVTQFMIDITAPQLGETVLDPACGTGGFLTGAIEHVRNNHVKAPDDEARLQSSIRGVEKKQLPHLLCTTNMLLHGIDVPTNVVHDNTLARPLRDYGNKDRVDVILTNPPFDGTEEPGVEANFPANVRTRETEALFLALVIHLLKDGGRAAIVLPDSSLFEDGVKQVLREKLLCEADLHTIVRLSRGVFSPYTDISTNILFFEKGRPTEGIWFYEVKPQEGEKFTKTRPIRRSDFNAVGAWWSNREQTDVAWFVDREEIAGPRFNLNIENPTKPDFDEAYERAKATHDEAMSGLDHYRAGLHALVESAPGPVGELAEDLLTRLARSPITPNLLEDLRASMTGLALRGELSRRLAGDPSVEETLAGYTHSARRPDAPLAPPPFPIPEHWKWVQLNEISDFVIGRTPSTGNSRYWAPESAPQIPWVSISDMPRRGFVGSTAKTITDVAVQEAFAGRAPVPPGTLLMSFKLSLGKTAIANVACYHNEAVASMALSDERLKSYLVWAFPLLAQYAGSNPAVRGSTLNTRSINAMWVPIPPSAEQERLVATLRWTVDRIEDLAHRSETAREASGDLMKVLLSRA